MLCNAKPWLALLHPASAKVVCHRHCHLCWHDTNECRLSICGWFLQLGLALALACVMLLGLVTALGLALLVVMLSQSTEESLPQRAQAEVLQLGVGAVRQVMHTAFHHADCCLSTMLSLLNGITANHAAYSFTLKAHPTL